MLAQSKPLSVGGGIVPVLVDQFNDIIEWKQQVLKKEVDSFEAQKVATAKVLPMLSEQFDPRRYSAADIDLFGAVLQKSHSTTNLSNGNHYNDPYSSSAFPKLKRSKSQKCFTKKMNRCRMKAINNTISEGETEFDFTGHELDSIAERLAKFKLQYKITSTPKPKERVVKFADEPMEIDLSPLAEPIESPFIAPTPVSRNPRISSVIEDLNELKYSSFKAFSPEPEPEVAKTIAQTKAEPKEKKKIDEPKEEKKKVEPVIVAKPMPTFNVLLEKLRTIYRHNFVVKTVVVDIKSRIAEALGKAPPIDGKCPCGEPFTFSDKTLQCILCLTCCHTKCASSMPAPCIKFVDPNLRPSKLISNYVYPRSKPAIPSLIVQCCREIETKCSVKPEAGGQSSCLMHAKLYYVESERLKPVKDQCKRMLTQGKLGMQTLDQLSLDHLCGMIKHFLAEVCEPVFTPQNWKEYSVYIHKKSEDELTQSLVETFDQMAPANVQTLCFMLLHLKHLNRCGYQDLDILADIFCPILLGDVEVRRKQRLMKIMFQIEDNVLLSFVER